VNDLDCPDQIVLGRELPKDRCEPSTIRDGCIQEPTTALHFSILENLGHGRDGRTRLFDEPVASVHARHVSQRTVPRQQQHAATQGSFDRCQQIESIDPDRCPGHRFGGGAARPPFDALIFTARATANGLSLPHRQAIPIAHEGERCSQRIAATEQPAEIGDGASQGGQRRLREELRILKIEPDHAQVRYLVSHIYIQSKQYRKAETLLLALTAERPNDFTLMNNLAWVYATAEDPSIRNGDKAIKFAQEAMLLAPNDHHVWSTLSEAYYMSGEYEKAYRAIEHMARLATRYGTGITEESVKDYNEQIRKCKRAMDTADAMKDFE